jgi:type IV secretory pathway component VirB8
MVMEEQDSSLDIEDGSYFREARKWYSVKYIALISERVIYIIITLLSFIVLIVSIIAIYRLMPLKPSVPFTYISKNGVETVSHIELLEREWGEPSDVSLRRYFCQEYVERREGYNINQLNTNVLYVYNHSDDFTAREYRDYMDKSNPRSPIVLFQARIERKVAVSDVTVMLKEENKYECEVSFSAIIANDTGYEETFYRAKLQFDYTNVAYEYTDEDAIAGKPLKVTPMTFKVTEYSVKQRK